MLAEKGHPCCAAIANPGQLAHQATNVAAGQTATIDQTAGRFGADRQLLGRGFTRHKRKQRSCAGCPKGCGIRGILLNLRHARALAREIVAQPCAVLAIVPKFALRVRIIPIEGSLQTRRRTRGSSPATPSDCNPA